MNKTLKAGAAALLFAGCGLYFLSTASWGTAHIAAVDFITAPLIAAEPSPQPVVSEWNVRDHIPRSQFNIEAHRGYGNFGPEGSDDSFQRAWREHLIPEADLRLTKDGRIVSFHDGNFARILPDAPEELKKKGVQDLTLEEVKQLDIGACCGEQFKGQHALSLAEIVAILKENPAYRVNCDIKSVDFAQLAHETEGVHPQICVGSSSYDEILAWKEVAPDSPTQLWMGGKEEAITARLDELEKNEFRGIDELQIHAGVDEEGNFYPSLEFMKEAGERLRRYGVLFQSLIWGPPGGRAENYWKMMDAGVASFATDYPQATNEAIDRYYEMKKQ